MSETNFREVVASLKFSSSLVHSKTFLGKSFFVAAWMKEVVLELQYEHLV